MAVAVYSVQPGAGEERQRGSRFRVRYGRQLPAGIQSGGDGGERIRDDGERVSACPHLFLRPDQIHVR